MVLIDWVLIVIDYEAIIFFRTHHLFKIWLSFFKMYAWALWPEFVSLALPPIANFSLETVTNNWGLVGFKCAPIIFDRTRSFPRFRHLLPVCTHEFNDRFEFRSRNCLNQLSFNCAYCATIIFARVCLVSVIWVPFCTTKLRLPSTPSFGNFGLVIINQLGSNCVQL